jgi:glutamate 5-kinase
MGSKLEAVGFATSAGIETWILDGMQPGRIAAALTGEDTGTRFPAKR